MERSLRCVEVWGQRNYWPMSELIAKRYSKPRPVRGRTGCCKEKTKRQRLSLKTENQRLLGKSL